jgi:phosphate butyryltransferase
MESFSELKKLLSGSERTSLVVAAAQDDYVLEAVYEAYKEGFCDAILVGVKEEILAIEAKLQIPEDAFEIVDVQGETAEQCEVAVDMVVQGKAQFIMKGLVETKILLKAILQQKEHLLTGEIMNHLAVFDIPEYHKLLFMSDSGMIISPTLKQKEHIIANALPVMSAFGLEEPKIALLCAKEVADPKMPATTDAEALKTLNEEGMITDCIISGPIAMDVAISKEAAEHKGIESPVAGEVDLLIMPSIEAGNILYKTLVKLGRAKSAGIITGASVPIVLTSRSDSAESKLNSIMMGALVAVSKERK